MSKSKTGRFAFLANPKSRIMAMAVAAVFLGGVAFAINGVLKKNALTKEQSEATNTAALPANANQKTVIDPNKVDDKQSELRKAANEEAAKQADSNGQTFIATMRPEVEVPKQNVAHENALYMPRATESAGFARRVALNEPTEQEIREAEAAHRKKVDDFKRRMSSDKSAIHEAWDPNARVFYTAYVEDQSSQNGRTERENSAAPVSRDSSDLKKPAQVFAKAGEVFYGVIDIGLNTDEPSAVTAFILNGPFKGGRLLGAMAGQTAPYSEKAVIQFTSLNHPRFERSIPVRIFAVDKNTRRAAVADNVDRHLLAKFGLAAAVDFAQGYAEGKAQNTSTIMYGQNGAPTVVTQNELTNKQLVARGAARTMGRVANTLAPYTNRPNTLEVYSQTEIGLLVASDIVYSEGMNTDNAPVATPPAQTAVTVPRPANQAATYPGMAQPGAAYSQPQIYAPQSGQLNPGGYGVQVYSAQPGYAQPAIYGQTPVAVQR